MARPILTDQPLDRFLDCAQAALRIRESALARRTADEIAALPAERFEWETASKPAAAHFERACALGGEATAPLVEAAAALAGHFQWRGGGDHGFGDRLRGDLAYVELAGPTGLAPCETLRLGLFLLGPKAFYPNHSHAADELYYVIGGRGEWQTDGGAFIEHGPGALIEVPSFTPHALRTGAEPVLTVYAWTGDVGGAYRVL